MLYSVAPQYSAGTTLTLGVNVLGGLLPIGKYRFTVFSNATTSIHDLAGQALDGNGDGAEQGSFVRVFDIISPNQSPSFTKGADLAATDESGPQAIAAWATAISTGPPSEAAQSLTFVVTTDNDALFASLPSIDAAGKLSFTPAPNANGIVHVTIVLHDDGGTAAGGMDASPPQTFTITLIKVHAWHNTQNQYDVNGDRHVAPNDVLDIINRINALQGGAVPQTAPPGSPYYDVNNDGFIAPNDALLIINVINAGQAGEGESDTEQGATDSADDFSISSRGPAADSVLVDLIPTTNLDALIAALADDIALTTWRRRA